MLEPNPSNALALPPPAATVRLLQPAELADLATGRDGLDVDDDLGMSEVLITCGKTNLASVRTILRAGGILVSEEFLPEREEVVQRYRIELQDAPPKGGA